MLVDLHCHILPMDDGAKDMDMAVEMARNAMEEGVTDIVATPHFSTNDYAEINAFLEKRGTLCKELNERLKQENITVKVHPAAEVMLHPNLLQLPMDQLAIGGRFILFELSLMGYQDWFKHVFFEAGLKGYTLIMAHPERYNSLLQNKKILNELTDAGLLMQSCVNGISAKRTHMQRSGRLFAKGSVTAIGSDMHSARPGRPGLAKTYDLIAKTFGLEYANMLKQNASKILLGEDPETVFPSGISFINRIKIGGIS